MLELPFSMLRLPHANDIISSCRDALPQEWDATMLELHQMRSSLGSVRQVRCACCARCA